MKILISAFLFTSLIFIDSAYSQEVVSQVAPIGSGQNYACVQTNTRSVVARFVDNGYEVISVDDLRSTTQKQITQLKKKLRRSSNKSKVKRKIKKKRILLSDINKCERGTVFNILDAPCNKIGTGAAFTTSPIIAGNACVEGNSAFVLLLLANVNGDVFSICTGSVISKKEVLTAAHCLVGDVQLVGINSSQDLVSAELIPHPRYDGTTRNDIGIVRFNKNISRKRVAVIGTKKIHTNSSGESVVIGGYGRDENGDIGMLRAGTMFVNSANRENILSVFNINDTFMDSNTCNGDSGGPLLVRRNGNWILAGATSAGSDAACGVTGVTDFSVFANLTNPENRSFIKKNTRGVNFAK